MKQQRVIFGLAALAFLMTSFSTMAEEKNALARAREKCCKEFGWHYSLSEGTEINGGICYPENMDVKLEQARAFNACLEKHGQKGDAMLNENAK